MDLKIGDDVYFQDKVWQIVSINRLTPKTAEVHIRRWNHLGKSVDLIVVSQALKRVGTLT